MNMKLNVISFTENGKLLSENIAKMLEREIEINLFTKCKACMSDGSDSPVLSVETSVGDWAKTQMQKRIAMLFIGACGIAVRAIASNLTDKLQDAPVLVMDEKGKYIIPILSGHIGGGNELANYIADRTGAVPVITTATDINKRFAVDMFAKRNGLYIVNKDGIAKVSSKALAGEKITMSIEPGHGIDEKSCLPAEVRLLPYPPAETVDVVVTSQDCKFDTAILLRPQEYIIGIGCKRGKSADEIGEVIMKKINELGISITQIMALSSISQKCDEQGILEWCRKEDVLFFTYTAEELQKVKGNFTKSDFVKDQVGVDNVCERAALKACGEGGKLIVPKYAENGITIAIAKNSQCRKWVTYEK